MQGTKTKDGLAMQRCDQGNRYKLGVVLALLAVSAGCRRAPYIDTTKVVPHDPTSLIAKEDTEVKQAQLLDNPSPIPLPQLADPRTTSNPEAEEYWEMTLQEALRIGLDNAEVIRVIPLRPFTSESQ